LEECELLAQQFHEVVRELASAGERVAQVLALKGKEVKKFLRKNVSNKFKIFF